MVVVEMCATGDFLNPLRAKQQHLLDHLKGERRARRETDIIYFTIKSVFKIWLQSSIWKGERNPENAPNTAFTPAKRIRSIL